VNACTAGTDYCWDTATKVGGCCLGVASTKCVAIGTAGCTITTGCATAELYTYGRNPNTPNLD